MTGAAGASETAAASAGSVVDPGGIAMSTVRRFAAVEIWERFSFYAMGLLVPLFLIAPVRSGGFGWNGADALRFYGLYIAAVQFLPLLGGWIGDRWLHPRRALAVGAWLMFAGHLLLTGPHLVPILIAAHSGQDVLASLAASGVPLGTWPVPEALDAQASLGFRAIGCTFYLALGLLAIGNGFFKPTFAAVLGRLPYANHGAREAAFMTLYMYVHIGAIAASLGSGWVAQTFGWHWAFGLAAAGMLMALVLLSRLRPEEFRAGSPRVSASVVGAPSLHTWLPQVLLLLCVAVAFYVADYQVMGLLNVFADQRTDRVFFGHTVPSTWFISLNPALIVTLAPLLTWLALRAPAWNAQPMTSKLVAAFVLTAIAFAFLLGGESQARVDGQADAVWVIACIACITFAELFVAPLGAAAIARLAPAAHAGVVLGAWYAANGIGGWLSGQVGGAVVEHGQPVIATIAGAAALIAAGLWVSRARLVRGGL